ncbi:MAG: O-antigen ligase family protein [Candidatus Eisenbacteria bacterium]|nr:O-antigen ligase family protein [Candidatus Eisenbacteria bacterium]
MSARAQGSAADVATRPAGPLVAAAGAAFVLFAFVLPGSIAPMGIGAALCGALTIAAIASGRARWPYTPVNLAWLGWLLALLLSAVFAVDRGASLPRLGKGFMPLLVGLAALHGADRRTGERALAAYLAASGVVAALGIGLWLAHGASFESRARGLSGHYMTFAGQLLLELPVALGVALLARGRRWRLGAAAVAVVGLVALAATFTRSAWIGLLVSGAVLLGACAPLGLVALALLAVAAWFLTPGTLGERVRSVFDPANKWNEERMHMWDAGLRMFRDHPLTGVGLQDLHALYDRYRSPAAVERAGHLHNVVVQIAATMGVVGLAAFTWLYGSLVSAASAGLRPLVKRRGLAAGLKLGVTAALAGFLVAGFFEWNFGDEELLYPLFTLVGLAWAAGAWDGPEA